MKIKRLALCAVLFLIANTISAQSDTSVVAALAYSESLDVKHEVGVDLMPAVTYWNLDNGPRFQAYYRRLGKKSNFRTGIYYRTEPIAKRVFIEYLNDTVVRKTEERPRQRHLLLTIGTDRWWSVKKNKVDFFIGIDGLVGLKFVDFDYTQGECGADEYCYLVPRVTSPQHNARAFSSSATYASFGIRPYYGLRFQWGQSMGLVFEGGPIATWDSMINSEGEIMREDELKKLVYLDLFPIQNVSFYFRF